MTRRAALIAALAEAPESASPARPLLDLAALSLSHGLLPEGRSFLDRLGPDDTLDPAPRLARHKLALLAWALDGQRVPADRPERALLEAEAEDGWADRPLHLALDRARSGDAAAAAPHLGLAEMRLDALPPAVAEALLPELLQTAIDAGAWETGQALARRFDRHAGLRGGSAYRYLLGRAAAAHGDLVLAFDSFALSAEGADAWAQRARIALIDLGRDSGALQVEDARSLLEHARRQWRGDELELAVLERLVEAELDLGDRVAALSVLGEIIRRHPGSTAAEAAGPRADLLITALYEAGAAGELPIAGFVAAHRRLAPEFMFRPGFAPATEALAARLLEVGATDAAAREYRMLRDQLAVQRDLDLAEVAPGRIARLALDETEALLQGGQADRAAAVLAEAEPMLTADLADRAALLRARLHSATGESDAVIATRMGAPSEGYLLIRARAHFARGEWAEARDAYAALRARPGAEVPAGDEINLLLAAHRAGDAALVETLLADAPALVGRPEWAEVARHLAPAPPLALPLRQKSAQDRVQTAADALRRLELVAGDG
ncbi:hypothetical protein [Limimaricola pyoseonensis]|uniref:Tetratricopeptide repeat-containing protein n=1 Tax=Limimaricola pyoseonensis TaxID=521013 RepID=A0A1G7KB15_9RHOB|nr:hypothetical protein [Limimaricola pyoseonensis]SDF34365.1 hypothetical protein SAMN04488567_0151 [Limimaricola pyoseonensis]